MEPCPQLLRSLQEQGVILHDCPDLHAKVMLLDNQAVIGSANMSLSSVNSLVELSVLTDQTSIVAGVASFIEQRKHAPQLTPTRISRLCKIKVVPRERVARHKTKISCLGNQTWLLRLSEYTNDASMRKIDLAKSLAASK